MSPFYNHRFTEQRESKILSNHSWLLTLDVKNFHFTSAALLSIPIFQPSCLKFAQLFTRKSRTRK